MKCPKCNEYVKKSEGLIFCQKCGSKLIKRAIYIDEKIEECKVCHGAGLMGDRSKGTLNHCKFCDGTGIMKTVVCYECDGKGCLFCAHTKRLVIDNDLMIEHRKTERRIINDKNTKERRKQNRRAS